MHAKLSKMDLLLPGLFFRPVLAWDFGVYWSRPTPMHITWSLVINIPHAIIEILCRVMPDEDINGAKQDIGDVS